MGLKARQLFAIGIVLVEIVSIGVATITPASAETTAQERREIRRQQRIVLQQRKEILENQRRLDSQRGQLLQRSPVTGEVIDQQKLPKGLLSGVLPSCPLGFAYNPFVGCVLYVAH